MLALRLDALIPMPRPGSSDLSPAGVSAIQALQRTAGNQVVQRLLVQRVPWSDDIHKHLAIGEYNDGPTGYHWKGDSKSVLEGDGNKSSEVTYTATKKFKDDSGAQQSFDSVTVYNEGVQVKAGVKDINGKKVTKRAKSGGSTFFPDAWSLDDLKYALAKAARLGSGLEVAGSTNKKVPDGFRITPKGGATYYPNSADMKTDEGKEEERGGRGRGGKKR